MTREAAFETYCSNLAAAYDRLTAEGSDASHRARQFHRLQGLLSGSARFRPGGDRAFRQGWRQVVLDVYDAAVNGEDAIAFVRDNPGRVAHIQLADYPGRHEPGEGTIDFARLFEVLGEVGYSGSVGLEYVPTRPITNGVPIKELLGLA